MTHCTGWIAPNPTDGKVSNSCANRGCGKSLEAHIEDKKVRLIFQGRLKEFDSWDEAHDAGYYTGSLKESDYGRLVW